MPRTLSTGATRRSSDETVWLLSSCARMHMRVLHSATTACSTATRRSTMLLPRASSSPCPVRMVTPSSRPCPPSHQQRLPSASSLSVLTVALMQHPLSSSCVPSLTQQQNLSRSSAKVRSHLLSFVPLPMHCHFVAHSSCLHDRMYRSLEASLLSLTMLLLSVRPSNRSRRVWFR